MTKKLQTILKLVKVGQRVGYVAQGEIPAKSRGIKIRHLKILNIPLPTEIIGHLRLRGLMQVNMTVRQRKKLTKPEE